MPLQMRMLRAGLVGIELDTLTAWERGLCVPEDIAHVYLRVVDQNPGAAAAALLDCAKAAASEAGAPE
jgi:hypothetical protein